MRSEMQINRKALQRKDKFILWVILIILMLMSCKKDEEISSVWSSYQGEMNWNEAIEKCKNTGTRLPTKDEFNTAYTKGITKSWEKNYTEYWTSDEDSNNNAFIFYVYGGYNFSLKTGILHVRCIK